MTLYLRLRDMYGFISLTPQFSSPVYFSGNQLYIELIKNWKSYNGWVNIVIPGLNQYYYKYLSRFSQNDRLELKSLLSKDRPKFVKDTYRTGVYTIDQLPNTDNDDQPITEKFDVVHIKIQDFLKSLKNNTPLIINMLNGENIHLSYEKYDFWDDDNKILVDQYNPEFYITSST